MRKYREEIEKYIDEHKDEMVEDIKRLCSIALISDMKTQIATATSKDSRATS